MNDDAIATYRNLMLEVRFRVEAIDSVLEDRLVLRARIAEELCYLQLRMICEIIAVGCLVIHGNLKPKPDLIKSYKADWIVKELEKLHKNFYPDPLEPEDGWDTKNNSPEWVHKKTGFLTKDDLVKLWSSAGAILHHANAKNVLKSERPLAISSARKWRNKVVELLNRHTIISPDGENICYFLLNDGQGQVYSALFERQR